MSCSLLCAINEFSITSSSTVFFVLTLQSSTVCLQLPNKQICLTHYPNHSACVKIRVCQYGSQTGRLFFNRFDVVFKCVILSPLSGKELIYFQHSAFVTNLCGILVSFKASASCFQSPFHSALLGRSVQQQYFGGDKRCGVQQR